MRADGTLEHGVDDVAEFDLKTRIRVAAIFNKAGSTCTRAASTRRAPPLVTREVVGGDLHLALRSVHRLDAQDGPPQ